MNNSVLISFVLLIMISLSTVVGLYFETNVFGNNPPPTDSESAKAATSAKTETPATSATPATPATSAKPATSATSATSLSVDSNRGFCIDLPSGSTTNSTYPQLYSCNGTDAQKWSYDTVNKAIVHIPSKKCLDIPNNNSVNGAKIQLYDCNQTAAQRWEQIGKTFKANGKCLDIPGSNINNGQTLQLYDCNGTAAQNFAFI